MAREDYPEGCAIHVKDVAPARVGPETGWQDMDIRFIVDSRVAGRGAQGVGRVEYEVTPGVSVFTPRGATHWLRNLDPNEPVEVIGVYVGGSNIEESGYRYVGPVTDEDKKLR